MDAPPNHPPTAYDLIANVTHESTAGTTRDKENTVYKVHLRAGGTDDDWYQIQDLIVEKTRREMIFLGETVLQVRSIFTRCSLHPRSYRSGNEGACLQERKWMLISSRLQCSVRNFVRCIATHMESGPFTPLLMLAPWVPLVRHLIVAPG